MRTFRLMRPDAWRTVPPSAAHARFGTLRAWLTDRGSLTARIVAHFPRFKLRRIKQDLARPTRDERREISLRHGQRAVVREVLLCDAEHPLVFAHSVAATHDLRKVWRGLSKLGSRPLAEMLFADPAVARLPMEYKKIDARHPLYRRAQKIVGDLPPSLWARRSVFLKAGRPLLVSEVFVAEMPVCKR